MTCPARTTACTLAFAALALTLGCQNVARFDFDGDGIEDSADCAPEDATRYPGAPDLWGDGIDQNCDGGDGIDGDGDGYPGNPELADEEFFDCNDSNAEIHPGADELLEDGYDNDCDGTEAVDRDNDGYLAGFADCDDEDPLMHQDAFEQPNAADDDCDGLIDEGTPAADDDGDGACEGWDLDGDGAPQCADGAIPGDCDDADYTANLRDEDGDGQTSCALDCDDYAADVWFGAPELCDGLDSDCDGEVPANEADDDGDGARLCDGDCDDFDGAVAPGNGEVCNGFDDDCDVDSDEGIDFDGDGVTICAGDCDDGEAAVVPGAAELCDGLDNDCDGPADEGCSDCDLDVPTDHPTVQGAIDAAAPGDLVCVQPATWIGGLDFGGKSVHVLGVAGPLGTVIDAVGLGPVVTFASGETGSATLQGLTLTGGSAENGGGVWIEGASPTLIDVVITGNVASANGGGVAIAGASSPAFEEVVIQDNSAAGTGGGVHLGPAASLQITGSVIESNQALSGGGLAVSASTLDVSDSVIAGNTALFGGGGGLYIGSGTATLQRVIVSGNTGAEGGGAIRLIDSSATLGNVAILANSAGGQGGVSLVASSATLSYCTVARNNGFALHVSGASSLQLAASLITGNTGYGLFVALGNAATVESTAFYGNVLGSSQGAATWTGVNPSSDDPGLLDTVSPNPRFWDIHLSATSGLVDAGPATVLDPDGSQSDFGAVAGPWAGSWDLDGDGFPSWWQPGPYDASYSAQGWDCDDQDASVYPGSGC